MDPLSLRLSYDHVKVLLRAFAARAQELEAKGRFADEDQAALAGNDIVLVRLLRERIEKEAVAHFGEDVLNLSEELL
jgi:hypothetical protein